MPEDFIERQLNDSRYISRFIKGVLSNIVREKLENDEYEPEAISKKLITCSGGVTDRLKKDWGLNDVWNSIISPRFERLNKKTDSKQFGDWVNKDGKRYFQTDIPLELQRGFSKKRIDHRHHAMDAIVIACATLNHINYLNNESARKKAVVSRLDLRKLLCDKSKTDDNGNYRWVIKKPWDTFTQDTYDVLQNIIVSFKQNLRVVNKATNYYQQYNELGKKVFCKQKGEEHWAIRKSLHKATVYGNVNLRKIKNVKLAIALNTPRRIVSKELKNEITKLLSLKYNEKMILRYFKENKSLSSKFDLGRIAVYYFTNETSEPLVAVRKTLDVSFTKKKIAESVTDTGIQKILLKHLENNGGDSALAFSPDGIDDMNRNLFVLNDKKQHQPIFKVRVYESLGNKFQLGETGNKTAKYVEADKGTNLFFAIYQNADSKRIYETIPLNIAIEREKQGLHPVPERNMNGDKLLMFLSPNDLVYLPTPEELENGICSETLDRKRIYKNVSFSGSQCFFVPYYIASPIINTIELGANNKAEKNWEKEMIKAGCVKIKTDRLGHIIEIGKLK